jgi:hypothetical protein
LLAEHDFGRPFVQLRIERSRERALVPSKFRDEPLT